MKQAVQQTRVFTIGRNRLKTYIFAKGCQLQYIGMYENHDLLGFVNTNT